MSTYRLFQSPEGDVVRVKQGFSFQAFFVGSLTTLMRRYWWIALLAAAAWFLMGFTVGMQDLGTRGIAFAAVLGTLCLLYMLFCGFFGNRWLAESLRRRGFRMVGEERGRLWGGPAPTTRTARAGTSPSP